MVLEGKKGLLSSRGKGQGFKGGEEKAPWRAREKRICTMDSGGALEKAPNLKKNSVENGPSSEEKKVTMEFIT